MVPAHYQLFLGFKLTNSLNPTFCGGDELLTYFPIFVPESKTDKISNPKVPYFRRRLLIYFPTFLPESKTDTIPKSHLGGGGSC